MKAAAIEIRACEVSQTGRPDSRAAGYQAVVGLDVGDRQTHYCVLDLDGDVVVEGAVATREASLRVQFEGKAQMRIALEAGTHSPWISRLLAGWGHNVIVANPRKVRLISRSDSKNEILRTQGRWLAWRGWGQSCCRRFGSAAKRPKWTWRW